MAVREGAATGLGPRWIHLFCSVVIPCPRYTWGDRVYSVQCHEERVCLSLSTARNNLFGGNGVLESLVNLNLNASLSLLFLRTISSYNPLGFGEVGPDGL